MGLLIGSPVMNEPAPDDSRQKWFSEFLAGLRNDLFRYAFWLTRDPDLADDVVQEATLRAWKSLDRLRDEVAVKAWLLTIVRREWARTFERKRLDTQDIDGLSAAEAVLVAGCEDHELDDLRKAIFRLEDDYREPLVLQVVMGYSTQEIADLMGLKQGAVLTRLHRARKRLMHCMENGSPMDE
jgi:RNA polymerase sigma-70 factor, ECF subfamily